jgi:hypothetical protein
MVMAATAHATSAKVVTLPKVVSNKKSGYLNNHEKNYNRIKISIKVLRVRRQLGGIIRRKQLCIGHQRTTTLK